MSFQVHSLLNDDHEAPICGFLNASTLIVHNDRRKMI